MDELSRKKRAYLSDQPPELRFDDQKLTGTDFTVSEAFRELARQLSQHFEIDRGVLVLRQPESDGLSAISTWHQGQIKDGLLLSLPSESSLFEKVTAHGRLYTENFCGAFSGNFFERKLLLDEDSRSFAIQPLKRHGEVIGLIGFSSRQPTAFATFEEGVVDEITHKFAAIIAGRK